jgi:hypothetical protein
MSLEKTMRKRVVAALKSLHAVSVENGCGLGTPDVNCVSGWLELKSIEGWPVRPDTPVKIEHLSQDQRVWLLMRRRAGGRAWLLLKVADDWLLFDGADVFDRRFGTEMNRAEVEALASKVWHDGLDDADLLEIMC